jgi:monoamine oxidase
MTALTNTDRRRVVGGIIASPFIMRSDLRAQETIDVMIIGGGLAGLNAAWVLAQAGISARVLEGSGRVGGRAKTAYDVETQPELGASQVGHAYARVRDAINRLGLTLIPEHRPLMPFANFIGGRLISQEEWPEAPENKTIGDERTIPPVQMQNILLDRYNPLVELDDWLDPKFASLDISVLELFSSNGISKEAMRLAKMTTGGIDLSTISAMTLFQESNRGKFGEAYYQQNLLDEISDPADAPPRRDNIKGGTSKLPEAIAAQLSNNVLYNKIVTRIHMDDHGADVYCIDGSRFRSKYIISAVPFNMLRRIAITPELEGANREAVNHMPYLYTTRANVRIKEPFWEEDGFEPSLFTETASRMFWAIDKRPEDEFYQGSFVLMGNAAARIDAMPQDLAPEFLLKDLHRIRPSSKGKVEIIHYHSWGNTPLQGACRHSFAPGQVTKFAQDMIKPSDRLHFAGEHTRRLEYGMEAAMETGERAALEILERA